MKSTYSLNLFSKFSYKVHCKAGILAPKYDSECPCFRRLWDFASPQIPRLFIQFGFPLSTSQNYSGKKKKKTQLTEALFSFSLSQLDHQFAICIGTDLRLLLASPSLEWWMSWHTLFFLNSIWSSFTLPTMAQLLAELPKSTFIVWMGGFNNWEYLIKCNIFFQRILHGALIFNSNLCSFSSRTTGLEFANRESPHGDTLTLVSPKMLSSGSSHLLLCFAAWVPSQVGKMQTLPLHGDSGINFSLKNSQLIVQKSPWNAKFQDPLLRRKLIPFLRLFFSLRFLNKKIDFLVYCRRTS